MEKQLTKELAAGLLVERPRDAYKGSVGRALVVAGSLGLTGAAYLASYAALRAGAGLVTLAANRGIADVMAVKCTEVMPKPVKESSDAPGALGIESLPEVLALAEQNDTILIGPGLGRSSDTIEFVRELIVALKDSGKQFVIDADGLFALGGQLDLLKGLQKKAILTPHLGELQRLINSSEFEVRSSEFGVESASINFLHDNLTTVSQKLAKEWDVVLVAKCEKTVVANPDGDVYVTTVGNEGMATAGCGDVLAGTIAGIAAEVKDKTAMNAALVGTYLHGHAGDMAYENFGNGLIAGDILNNLPAARMALEWETQRDRFFLDFNALEN